MSSAPGGKNKYWQPETVTIAASSKEELEVIQDFATQYRVTVDNPKTVTVTVDADDAFWFSRALSKSPPRPKTSMDRVFRIVDAALEAER